MSARASYCPMLPPWSRVCHRGLAQVGHDACLSACRWDFPTVLSERPLSIQYLRELSKLANTKRAKKQVENTYNPSIPQFSCLLLICAVRQTTPCARQNYPPPFRIGARGPVWTT